MPRSAGLALVLAVLVATLVQPSRVARAAMPDAGAFSSGAMTIRAAESAAGATSVDAPVSRDGLPSGLLDRSFGAPALFGAPTDAPVIPAPLAQVAPAAQPAEPGRFLIGANYQGPPDQAWQMWQDDRFDPTQIAQDFAKASAANLTVLRIFVQKPLADDVRARRWTKLDRVMDLADRHGLRLIVTLADYTEWDLSKLAEIDGAIAARYKGRPTILAFDLKNEPRIGDLGLSTYPGSPPPLQQAWLAEALKPRLPVVPASTPTPVPTASASPSPGISPSPAATPVPPPPSDPRADLVWVPHEQIAEYRATEGGQKTVPARLDDEQAFIYVNVVRAYRTLLDDAGAWTMSRSGGTSVRYLQSEDSAAWQPLIAGLNDTLAAYLEPRLTAIRQADPERLVTVGHVDTLLSVMPANDWLDYRTLHRYPPTASSAGVRSALALWDDVRTALPNRPLVLGEFGFANDAVDEATAASLEAEFVQGIRDRGGAGALKWMLNDFPSGANPRENSFGMFRGDGAAKPVVGSFQALGALALAEGATGLDQIRPAGSTARRLDPACEARGIAPAPLATGVARAKPTAWIVVAGTGGTGVYLRRSPRVTDSLTAWPDGTRLDVVGPDAQGDGLIWKQVQDPCGQGGWIPARYGAPIGAP